MTTTPTQTKTTQKQEEREKKKDSTVVGRKLLGEISKGNENLSSKKSVFMGILATSGGRRGWARG